VGVVIFDPEAVSVAAELSPEAVVLAAAPEVVSVVDLEISEPGVVFVAPFSIVHVSGRQVSVHIHTVFAVSIPVSFVVEGVDIFRRSIFFLFPNIDYYSSFSSFVEDVDKESVGSPPMPMPITISIESSPTKVYIIIKIWDISIINPTRS